MAAKMKSKAPWCISRWSGHQIEVWVCEISRAMHVFFLLFLLGGYSSGFTFFPPSDFIFSTLLIFSTLAFSFLTLPLLLTTLCFMWLCFFSLPFLYFLSLVGNFFASLIWFLAWKNKAEGWKNDVPVFFQRKPITPKHFSKTEDSSIWKFRRKDLKFYRVQVGPAALNKNFNKSLGKVKPMI